MSPVVSAAPAPPLRAESRHMRQLRGGHPHALDDLFRDYQPRLLSFCRQMLGNPEEAEDAVQLTFLAAHVQLPHEPLDTSVGAWLFTVARRKCIDVLRRRRWHDPLEGNEVSTAGLSAEVEQREDLRRLVGDLQRLDDTHRAALVLTQLEALSQAQVARVLNTNEPRVRRLVFEARQSLLERRDSRDLACRAVQEELANARGSQFRRRHLVVHCEECEECEEFRGALLAQRTALRAVLPAVPLVLTAKKAWAASSVPRPFTSVGRRLLNAVVRVPAPGLTGLVTVAAMGVAGTAAPRLENAVVPHGGLIAPVAARVAPAPVTIASRKPPKARPKPHRPAPAHHRKRPARAVVVAAAPGTGRAGDRVVTSTPAPVVAPATHTTTSPAVVPTPPIQVTVDTVTVTTPAVTVPTPTVTTPPVTVTTPPTSTTTTPAESGCTGDNNGNGQGQGCTPNGDPNGPGSPGHDRG
ncbi:MAG: RNA polymerase sigma factor [Solirubrobacteraceae bacterium]